MVRPDKAYDLGLRNLVVGCWRVVGVYLGLCVWGLRVYG